MSTGDLWYAGSSQSASVLDQPRIVGIHQPYPAASRVWVSFREAERETELAEWDRGTGSSVHQEGAEEETIWSLFEKVWAELTEEELQSLPTDLAEQHDHYIYGWPKRG